MLPFASSTSFSVGSGVGNCSAHSLWASGKKVVDVVLFCWASTKAGTRASSHAICWGVGQGARVIVMRLRVWWCCFFGMFLYVFCFDYFPSDFVLFLFLLSLMFSFGGQTNLNSTSHHHAEPPQRYRKQQEPFRTTRQGLRNEPSRSAWPR